MIEELLKEVGVKIRPSMGPENDGRRTWRPSDRSTATLNILYM